MCCCSAVCLLSGGLVFSLYTVLLSDWCKKKSSDNTWFSYDRNHTRGIQVRMMQPVNADTFTEVWLMRPVLTNNWMKMKHVSQVITEQHTTTWRVQQQKHLYHRPLGSVSHSDLLWHLYCSSHMCRHHSDMFVLFSQFFNQRCQWPVWSGTSRASSEHIKSQNLLFSVLIQVSAQTITFHHILS